MSRSDGGEHRGVRRRVPRLHQRLCRLRSAGSRASRRRGEAAVERRRQGHAARTCWACGGGGVCRGREDAGGGGSVELRVPQVALTDLSLT